MEANEQPIKNSAQARCIPRGGGFGTFPAKGWLTAIR
jgi:hypothetical protein